MTPLRGDVAYWLEVAEARAWADQATAIAGLDGNPFGAGVLDDVAFAAFWLMAVDVALFNRCVGLGVLEPATEAAVDRAIEPFRTAERTQFALQVSPFAQPSQLEAWLVDRGFAPARRWAKVWRETTAPAPERTELRIEAVGPDYRADFEHVILAAFEMPDFLAPIASATMSRAGWHHYLTFDGDNAVGAAAMYLTESAAWLGFASTLESHRGRGSQSALLSRRLWDAAALGLPLAVTETGEDAPDAPNPSYRNMLRAGFHLGYLRRNWLPATA